VNVPVGSMIPQADRDHGDREHLFTQTESLLDEVVTNERRFRKS